MDKHKIENRGRKMTFICTVFLIAIVLSIVGMVSIKGMSTFFVDKIGIFEFLFGTEWNPSTVSENNRPLVGALPMIVGSFYVTLISLSVSIPFSLASAIFMVELYPNIGKKVLQPVIELLVGIPSVIYGMLGLGIVVPAIRHIFGGSGFGVLSGGIVLTVMVLPTITTLCVDALESVDKSQKEAALALGATRWQMISKVVIKGAMPGILTAVVLGMSRAFGEALAVQMVIGNTTVIPKSIVSPASTLTSILTMNMGNTIPGQLENNVLWTLAFILMAMSLVFILAIRTIDKKSKF